jgi:hypothetical protein
MDLDFRALNYKFDLLREQFAAETDCSKRQAIIEDIVGLIRGINTLALEKQERIRRTIVMDPNRKRGPVEIRNMRLKGLDA